MKIANAFPVSTLKAHIALNVRNVATSVEFYRSMFGIEPSKFREGYAKFDLQNPPLNLSLNEVPFSDRGALSHLGIQVASTGDVIAIRENWKGAGLETRDEMEVNCCYAVQDKTWVTDPDGNEWEVFVVLEDNLAETTICCLPDGTLQIPDAVAINAEKSVTLDTSGRASCCEPGSGCC